MAEGRRRRINLMAVRMEAEEVAYKVSDCRQWRKVCSKSEIKLECTPRNNLHVLPFQ